MTSVPSMSLESVPVQIVVRGHRFQSTTRILSPHCLFFRRFFDEARVAGEADWTRCAETATAALLENAEADGRVAPIASVERVGSSGAWRFEWRSPALAPEDVGAVLVYVRKREERGAAELPIRWDEMTRDAQCGVAAVVWTFGVQSLMAAFGRPHAHAAAGLAPEEVMGAREKAAEYVRQRRSREARGVHASVADENLTLDGTACGRCGVTGHRDDHCPH